MPNNLTLDDVLNYDVSAKPASAVAEREAKLKNYEKAFDFDPNVSIASELELERQKEVQEIRLKAQQNPKTENFLNSSESNARIGASDVDGLNSISNGLNTLNGIQNLSFDSMESNLVKINADKIGGVFKGMAKELNQENKIKKSANQDSIFNQLKNFDAAKKPENKIEPTKDKGNKYLNAVKRGAASIIQLGALLYDANYEIVERSLDAITGFDVNGKMPYKTNKVFNVMQELKAEKYKESDSLLNLMTGADLAGKQAEEEGKNATVASLSYLLKNGSFGDAGEVFAEFAPSLALGAGVGGAAERGASALANRYVSNAVGRSIANNSVINPVRLAAVKVVAPKAVQGAVMSGTSDLVGSLAPEVEAQRQKGFEDGEAVGRALKKSLAQAGVTAAGGSLLPLRFGGDFTTTVGQSALQGLFGYGSAYAGAKSINEDLSSTEGALNILLGAVTALPEVAIVGGTSIKKADIQAEINDMIVNRAIADVAQKQELNETRSIYFGASIRELLSRIKSSKTNEISPETVRNFIRQNQADEMDAPTEVYLDVEKFNQLNTEYNIDIDSIFESSPELSKSYQRANDIDGLIRVPIDELLTAFSRINDEQYLNAFADSLRYHPEALTAGEARTEFLKTSDEMKADVSAMQEDFKNALGAEQSIAQVSDVIGADLANLENKFSPDYNNNVKTLVGAFYESLAAKTGVSAMDLYKAMPLRVVSNQEQASALMSGNIDTFNQDAEYKNIIDQYKNTDKWLKAPNGNDTKLTEKQWVVTKTESFKNWFGDWENDPESSSKIVDENGEPLVVYHGSNKDFDSFDPSLLSENTGNDGHYGAGIYFSTEREEAETYGKNVYEVFLNVKNPVRNNVDDLSKFDSEFGYKKEFKTIDKNWLVRKIKESDPNAGILAQLYSEGYTFDNVWDKFEELGGEYQGKLNLDEIGDIFENIDDSLGYYDIEFINENFGEIPDEVKKFGYDKEHDILDITDRGNAGRYFSDVVKKGGHDGVFAGSEIVVFNPEQVKSIKNKGSFNSDDVNIYNQSLNQSIDAELASLNDPQVELRKIYGYRDSHLAPDADGGVSGSQIIEVFPELNNRDFTKNYGDGFKYDAKTVKVIREMQKNPEGEFKVYRAVPDTLEADSLNFGDWVGLTKEYADEHGKARFDGKYKVIEQTVRASDLYTDGNSIHEWGYSPKSSEIYTARLQLNEQLKKLNDKLDQGIFKSSLSKTDVLGDKVGLKNNPALAKMFLDSKGITVENVQNSSGISDSALALAPELKSLEYNSDIKQNQDLLDRAFDALYLQDLRDEIDDPNGSEFSKNRAFNKLIKFSEVDNDKKFNLIDNKISKVKGAKSDGINEVKTRESTLDKAKSFDAEYDQFIDSVLRDLGLDYYNQKFEGNIRGQIQFRKDKKGAVIILGKDADFSTFTHELGHHFLEMSMLFANRPDAPEQLKTDMVTVMEWSKQGKGIEDWNKLTPEQKTEVHEKFAETFEQYLFTGKAPSNELRKVFARFRSFMAAVYRNIEKFLGIQKRAELNPEIRDVMDRMLATQEAIEQVQRQRNLEFTIAQDQAMEMGISPKDYLIMVEEHKEATEQAINELEQKTLKDLARYRTLRNKHVKAFSEQQKRVRQQVRESVAEEVAAMPVYQVLAYLRQPSEKVEKAKRDPNVVDPTTDTLIEAIAKMGGINAKEIESTWGMDKPETYKVNVGRVKKVARKDGLSIETVAERLAEYGYLSTDEYGKLDVHEFENLFTDSLSGGKYYSNQADHDLFMMGNDYGLSYGQLPEFPTKAKLNIEWLKARYGEDSELYKAVATTGRYGLASKDGIDPDMIADQFGFQSADAMLSELAASPAPKEVIEERSNALIQAKYSDLFDEKSMEMAIDEAVHNDIRAMMLARELTAVTKLQGRQNEFNAAAKSVAQNIIDNSLITEIRPHLFSAAELRQGKAYDKALKSGNTLDAVRAKRQQLINFHATKQAYEANAFVEKLFTLAKTVNGNDERLAKNRDFNVVAITRYILDLYGITDNQSNFEEHIKNLKQYDPMSATQVAELLYTKDELGNTVFRVPVKNYSEMTYQEFQVLNDVVRQLWHRSKENQKIKVGDQKIEFSKAVDNLISTMQKKPAKSRAGKLLGYTPRKATDFNPQRAFQTLKRAEQLFTWLDDGKSNGYFHEYVFNPMQDSLANYRLEQKKMMQEMINIYSEFDVFAGKIDATELGGERTTFESKQELLHAVLHTGNESNKQRLVLGFGWGEKLEDGSIDYSRWDAFIQRMYENQVITKKDMDAIQKIWNLFDGYKAQAQEVHKNLNGLYFKELPKSVVNTPFGMYEGGYIPADYDRLLSVEAEQRGKSNEATTQGNEFFKGGASTGANFTKSRVDAYRGDFMTLDLTQLPMHLDKELRYIHLEEQLKQASKIFRNKDVMKELESVSPFAIDSIISDWLTAVANQRVSKPTEYPTIDKFVEKLKQNSGIVLMAGNIKNAVEAWTSIPQLSVAVPKRELASTTAKYFTNAFSRENMTKQVRELSPFMDSRLDNVSNEMRYQLENIVTNPSKLKKGTDFLRQNAYFVQQVTQVPLETIGWMSAFNDAQTKGMSESDAVHHADGVVRMYLNDMSPEGISKIERSNPLVRAMLMFYGWFNMVHNTYSMNSKLINENSALSNIKKMGKHAGLYMMMIAMPAMLSKALTLSFNGELFNNDDSDDWADDLVNITAKSQAEMIFGMLPFARDVINPIYRTTFDATIYSDRYSVSPITSMAENLFKAGKSSFEIAENMAGGDNEIDASKVTKELLQASTFATGVPFTTIQRPATYAADVLIDGDQEPANIADGVRGTLNGK